MKIMSIRGRTMRVLLCAALPFVAVVVAGCGSHPRTTTPSLPEATTSTLPASDAAIVDAYRNFQQVYVAVGNPMNPDDPRLEEVATGPELSSLRKALAGLKVDGEVIEGTITVAPVIVDRSSTSATLRDCSVDASRFVKEATGQTVGDGKTTRELTTVTMSFVDGRWKVSDIKHLGSGCTSAS